MIAPVQAVILCGGLGTRLKPYTNSLPKPMMDCNGKPFLWHLLNQLHEQGINQFILLTGYLSNKIEDYFNDGSDWGWTIDYSIGPIEWDTGKRIWEARRKLKNRFLLLYSDNFATLRLNEIISKHEINQKAITFMVASKHPGNISFDEMGIVEKYDNHRSEKEMNYVEIGYMIVEKDKTLSFFDTPECSFSSILQKMSAQKEISGWLQNDQYHSISDPKRWKKTQSYLTPKKIILIDRDGVINQKAPQGEYINSWDDFKWITDTRTAMTALSKIGFQFIVITNQAGISRGSLNKNTLELIHSKMIEELEKDGIEIIDIYVCPHHWDEGCYCRKPNPGMLFQASNKHLLRLDKTVFIGDDLRDCQTAFKAGCHSIFIGKEEKLKKLSKDEYPIFNSQLLSECVSNIIEHFN
jgi:D-glycero-D-manno-heptose 1,7-bisphosphate phosphatase